MTTPKGRENDPTYKHRAPIEPVERPPDSKFRNENGKPVRRGFDNIETARRAAHKSNASRRANNEAKRKASAAAEAERKAIQKADVAEMKRLLGAKNLRELDVLGDDKDIPSKTRAEIKMFLVEHSLGKAPQTIEQTGGQTIEIVLSPKMLQAKAAQGPPALIEAPRDDRALPAG